MRFKVLRIAGLTLCLLGGAPQQHRSGSPASASWSFAIGVPAAAAGDNDGNEQETGGAGSDDRHGDDSERGGDRENDSGGSANGGDFDVRSDDGREFEPDTVLAIDLSATARRTARSMGFRVVSEEQFRSLGFRVAELSTPGGLPVPIALRRLRQADPAGSYDLNPRYAAAGTPCEGVRCDGQQLVGWPTAGCPLVTDVGVLDTAIAADNPALRGHAIEQKHFGNSGTSEAGARHGSEIASLFLGNAEAGFAGLLPRARIFAANIFDVSRDGSTSTNALKIAQGFDWLVGQHPAVINVALAGPDNSVLHETVSRVVSAGVPIVAAAGNGGHAGPPRYPAAYSKVIAVTAVDRYRKVFQDANEGDYITLAAPGVQLWVADATGQGHFADGTSFATPFVSAEIALLRSTRPTATPPQLTSLLRAHALRLGNTGPDPVFGAGLLQTAGCPAAVPPARN